MHTLVAVGQRNGRLMCICFIAILDPFAVSSVLSFRVRARHLSYCRVFVLKNMVQHRVPKLPAYWTTASLICHALWPIKCSSKIKTILCFLSSRALARYYCCVCMNKYEQYPSFLRIEPPLCTNQIIKAFVDCTCSRLSYHSIRFARFWKRYICKCWVISLV